MRAAKRTIAGYLAQAHAEGWRIGSARALVDDWRNEYELTKGEEKTVMRFDMRPMLTTSSRLDLVALTLIAGTSKLDEVIRNFQSMGSWPEAFAAAGLSFVDTSKARSEGHPAKSNAIESVPDIAFGDDRTIYWNSDALQKHFNDKVRLIGDNRTLELSRPDLWFLLTSAKACCGWKGGEGLFKPFGKSIGLYLTDEQVVSRADAAELARALGEFCQAQASTHAPQLKAARELAAFAFQSGFRTQLIPSQVPRGPTAENHSSHNLTSGSINRNKKKSSDTHGIVFLVSFIVAIAVGTYRESFLVGVIAYFVVAIVLAGIQDAILKRLGRK